MSAPRERVDATAPLEAERPADYLSRLAASELGRAYKAPRHRRLKPLDRSGEAQGTKR